MDPTRSRRERPVRASPLTLAYLTILCCALLAPATLAQSGPPAHDPDPYLVVSDAAGHELARISLAHHATWHLSWRHSVTGVRVRDFYALEDGTMTLTHSHTPSFDAGLGHIPGRGRARSDDAHGYWILGLDEPVPGNAYWLRVGSPEVAHTLIHPDARLNLSDMVAGQRVRIAVVTP